MEKLEGNIHISGLRFRCSERAPMVLHDLDLDIKAGEYVAIVGASGCGKSTLLRQHIGVVLQNSRLFAGSIYRNISISNPGMGLQKAWEVAEMAGIADDIRAMPMGMNTLVDENASCISGGQKQRIVIARALAGNPSILFFDEATSALDNITQKIVSDSLDRLHCTRVVIAHRLTTIKNCDRILMMADGRIIEQGSFDELIRRDGAFAKMVSRQRILENI